MVALAANIGKQNSSNEGESLRLEPLQRSMSDRHRQNCHVVHVWTRRFCFADRVRKPG